MGDKKQLNILFIPMDFTNQVTPGVGLAQKLIEMGHLVTFVVDESTLTLYKNHNLNVESIHVGTQRTGNRKYTDAVKYHELSKLSEPKLLWGLDAIKLMAMWFRDSFISYKKMINKSEQLRLVIDKYKPDLFVVEDYMGYASINDSKIPWVWLYDGNPLAILNDEDLPPPYTGLSPDPTNLMMSVHKWIYESVVQNGLKFMNSWFNTNNIPINYIMDGSPYLNIYAYPRELEYYPSDRKQMDNNNNSRMFRVDTFMVRDSDPTFHLPDAIHKLELNDNKKLIYVSMGMFGTANTRFMQRLIDILSRSVHVFIVSKGYFGDEFQLADNMLADQSLPSKKIIEAVDLVIIDGDTTIMNEAFSLGKPMIVMPFIMDQLDNGQRIQDTDFGLRLDPWTVTEQQLLEAIDRLLADNELKQRLVTASSRIEAENRLQLAAKLIEDLVK